MEYKEHIDRTQGTYCTTDDREAFENSLEKRDIIFDGFRVSPGEYTTLCDWFYKPCLFVGFLPDHKACFYLGINTASLFDPIVHHYDITYVFPDRIGKSYRPGTFRDAFLKKRKNGQYSFQI